MAARGRRFSYKQEAPRGKPNLTKLVALQSDNSSHSGCSWRDTFIHKQMIESARSLSMNQGVCTMAMSILLGWRRHPAQQRRNKFLRYLRCGQRTSHRRVNTPLAERPLLSPPSTVKHIRLKRCCYRCRHHTMCLHRGHEQSCWLAPPPCTAGT